MNCLVSLGHRAGARVSWEWWLERLGRRGSVVDAREFGLSPVGSGGEGGDWGFLGFGRIAGSVCSGLEDGW